MIFVRYVTCATVDDRRWWPKQIGSGNGPGEWEYDPRLRPGQSVNLFEVVGHEHLGLIAEHAIVERFGAGLDVTGFVPQIRGMKGAPQ